MSEKPITVVVIRQLDGHRPVTSMVFKVGGEDMRGFSDPTTHELIAKASEMATQHKKDVCSAFVEFEQAQWKFDVINHETSQFITSSDIK